MTRAWSGVFSRGARPGPPRDSAVPRQRHPEGGGRLPWWAVAAVVAGGPPGLTLGQAPPALRSDYEIKAAFLYNFTKYIHWPPASFAGPDSPIVIGALGRDRFNGAVEEIIRGREVDGRDLAHGECHLLFVGRDKTKTDDRILSEVRAAPVLTVGETASFGAAGGIVWFTLTGSNVRFTVNRDAAQRAGLRISSKLLAVATVVDDTQAGER